MTLRDATPRMTAAQLEAFLDEVFPQLHSGGRTYFVEEVGPMTARMRCDYHEKHLRPGGTISGPTMMALADVALYAAILGQIGPVALAVTTSLSFNFLRKPAPAALIGEARLLKLGKRLAVGEVSLYSQGESEMVAHATGTYSIPVER
ncbi:PaaI family thioesterase [Bosea sp. (in: a-proteobacteria)]|uniref:PaaI family thioesterase n=1 Tax=Bosea sp. (in: a-proteobacteria) TaxID=1871050 RepID=UPI002B4A5257|nr:PaaI family thioesterase [Bosea sp. (in: a-proteobacteria)]WRH58634.1 MAG: PaaI family thioesterase [Bosea sp. (in: a-proteobacteria)]